MRSVGPSETSIIVALSATELETSAASEVPARGTSSVEPALISIRAGMRLTSRNSSSSMPTVRAASAAFIVFGATQAVQVASGPRCSGSSRTNRLALS